MDGAESTGRKGMRPIWFFVGCMLTVIGIIVAGAGIYNWVSPPKAGTRLLELHTDLWWGAVILVFGLVLFFTHRNSTVE